MKLIILTTIAAVLLVGCGESQESSPSPETKPAESVAEASQPEPTTVKAPYMSIHFAAWSGNIKVVKQHLAAGTDVDAKNEWEATALLKAAREGDKEISELLINNGADLNAKNEVGKTPLDYAIENNHTDIADLLRKHGGKTGVELKAEAK